MLNIVNKIAVEVLGRPIRPDERRSKGHRDQTPGCMEKELAAAERRNNSALTSWRGFSDPAPKTAKAVWAAINRELTRGWPEGAALMQSAVGELIGPLDRARSRFEWGHFQGIDLDVGRALSGHPDCFGRTGQRRKPRKITIVCEVGGSGDTSIDQLPWPGALATVLADRYEAAGHPTDIYAIEMTANSVGTRAVNMCHVKDANESLVPDLLAAVLASPRVYRTGWLQACERLPMAMAFYGGIFTLDPSEVKQLDIEADEVIHIPLTIRGKDDAVAWLNAWLDSQSKGAE